MKAYGDGCPPRVPGNRVHHFLSRKQHWLWCGKVDQHAELQQGLTDPEHLTRAAGICQNSGVHACALRP